MARKSQEGYPSFDFESAERPPAGSMSAEGERPGKWGPAHIEESEQCSVCGNDFESTASCTACKNNKKKREYLKPENK
jgi:hypothetical protein